MEPLAKLLVSLIELAETELAMLKKSVVRLGLSLAMIAAAGVFGVIGFCWLLYALFLLLIRLTNLETAYAISGVVFLATAAILLVMAFRSKEKPKVAPEATTPVKPGEGNPDDPAANLRIAS
ncbi:MAG: hypothetical protein JWM57_1040 [Phycisphaerales bacterium]|nr:hypothetical protein [Phycisphaerales bacterium]